MPAGAYNAVSRRGCRGVGDDRQRERAVDDSDRSSRDIVRQWNREIEAEIRREDARRGGGGPWTVVAWITLWLLWLGLLAGLLAHLKPFR